MLIVSILVASVGWVVSFVVWLGAGECGRGFWLDLPCCCRPLDFLYIHALQTTLNCFELHAQHHPNTQNAD